MTQNAKTNVALEKTINKTKKHTQHVLGIGRIIIITKERRQYDQPSFNPA